MSIEYHLIVNSSHQDDIFFGIKVVFEKSDSYILSHSSDNAFGFSIKDSSSDWGADFEIAKKKDEFFIQIHFGNYKKIMSVIENFSTIKQLLLSWKKSKYMPGFFPAIL
ncbi:hypothetical protein GT614_10820 [Enterobacter hormaechei]|uniref:hypothetical protein n=1 Tax=Enterobacter hormaechei TaxID=158836 RepID=UPI001370376E|nr:hypothetical protein [Enterobacter hormaechei]NAJ00048.1 hypothetical protein [Escherichia coli]MZJ53273.1 hypothetical protein [Enterobacter hormaechei]MZJ75484.1 hypothetical protein [Enterobacter hormaechei]MZK03246.1 hypothetical protein [Enterobacter hormaechei]MZK14084.1 hypothetical protein [Enterobacter hormaechei]